MNKKVVSASVLALTLALTGSAWAVQPAVPDLVPSGYTIANTDALASRVINSKVYSGPAADAPEIGYVKDVVLGSSGQVSAVILGIGGFLGAGEKDVAVAYPQIQWTGRQRRLFARNPELYQGSARRCPGLQIPGWQRRAAGQLLYWCSG